VDLGDYQAHRKRDQTKYYNKTGGSVGAGKVRVL